ncbi:FAD:protein FMN transferase [Salinispirillum marinum]|uniref:FAD:protein FMN transferase n=2 Tax=Saccharospirillaceae TaxID=255527 RepID=A0ABV8BJ52_9GAMM
MTSALTVTHDKERQLWRTTFTAMASPCEILVDAGAQQTDTLQSALEAAAEEAWRIERKFSRFRPDSVLSQINQNAGKSVTVDPETAQLLNFADQCYALSQGLFDITSGTLRALWRFGSDATAQGAFKPPADAAVQSVLQHVGWDKVQWDAPMLTLLTGMQIDFGGIGKEYAVDRLCALLDQALDVPLVVNMGGDLRCNRPRTNGEPWVLGIEHPLSVHQAIGALTLQAGALATSGDTRRAWEHQGQRYGHILNPKTGWPVVGAPRSVTVAADTCTEAGIFSTLAMLHGPHAEAFLNAQGVPHWVFREES